MVLQWCELCQALVDDVEPARLRGRHLIMTCLKCRRFFPKREKVQWGRHAFQYYWDLGQSQVPLAGNGPKRPFLMTLSEEQVIHLTAAGYIVMEVGDESYTDS